MVVVVAWLWCKGGGPSAVVVVMLVGQVGGGGRSSPVGITLCSCHNKANLDTIPKQETQL